MAMRKEALSRFLGGSKKAVVINIIVLANTFIWYLYAFSYLITASNAPSFANQFLPVIIIHFIGLFLALVIGEFFSRKVKDKLTFLLLWMVAGAFLSILPLIAGLTLTYTGIMTFSIITGITFGFGLPSCLGYFSATTEASNRGKLGGITFFIIGVGAFIISFVGNENVITVALVLSAWKALGCLLLIIMKSSEKQLLPDQRVSYRYILSNRTFLLYFLPWLMFVFVNTLAFPIISKTVEDSIVQSSSNIEYVLGGISAIIFGFLADSKGRKRLIVGAFVLLGLGYGILAFSPSGASFGWWFYTCVDGVAWGIFTMVFVFALWGDLAEGHGSEKIYAVGIMPFLISKLLRYSIGDLMANAIGNAGAGAIFSYASFFLFLTVLPLIFAPETLPEQLIKHNDLISYINKAQKKVAKVQEQPKKDSSRDISQSQAQSNETQSKEYEKAKKLAEQYY